MLISLVSTTLNRLADWKCERKGKAKKEQSLKIIGISETGTNYTISVTANRVDQDCELKG